MDFWRSSEREQRDLFLVGGFKAKKKDLLPGVTNGNPWVLKNLQTAAFWNPWWLASKQWSELLQVLLLATDSPVAQGGLLSWERRRQIEDRLGIQTGELVVAFHFQWLNTVFLGHESGVLTFFLKTCLLFCPSPLLRVILTWGAGFHHARTNVRRTLGSPRGWHRVSYSDPGGWV